MNVGAMKICVFLSAADLDERYTAPAREFAELLGRGGHTLVWGGSDVGLMKVVADGVERAGGTLCGVSVGFLAHVARPGVADMVTAGDLGARKALLLEKADAVVVLVGGTGTLDEMTDLLELRRHGLTRKPLVVLNTAGYYDGLRSQLERMEAEGFLSVPLAELVHFARTGREALDHVTRRLRAGGRGDGAPTVTEAV
ncbi:TIGR00730 family Rossman fold protein [Streptomyces chumphonensis]